MRSAGVVQMESENTTENEPGIHLQVLPIAFPQNASARFTGRSESLPQANSSVAMSHSVIPKVVVAPSLLLDRAQTGREPESLPPIS